MVQFVVPRDGKWTFSAAVEVLPPGADATQSVGVTYLALAGTALSDLLRANAAGEISNADLVRGVAVSWDLTFEDGTPIDLASDDAIPILEQVWISRPIIDAYQTTVGRSILGNSPRSAEAGPPHDTALAPVPTTGPAGRKTGRR